MNQLPAVYEAAGSGQTSAWAFILPILLLLAFWLIAIRPARKRQRDMNALQRRVTPGSRVMTGAGLFATVVALEGDQVVLEPAPGVRLRYARQAVVRVLDPEPDAALVGPDDSESPGTPDGEPAGEGAVDEPGAQDRAVDADSDPAEQADGAPAGEAARQRGAGSSEHG